MMPWLTAGVILLVIILLSRLRLGGHAAYYGGAAGLWLKIGPFRMQVYPHRPARKKKSPKTEQKPAETSRPSAMGRVNVRQLYALARRLLPLLYEAAGRLRRKIRIGPVRLNVRVGGEDPGSAALAFGQLNGLIGVLFPLLERNFDCRDCRVRTEPSLEETRSSAEGELTVSMTLGQLVIVAVWFGAALLRLLPELRRSGTDQTPSKQKKAV